MNAPRNYFATQCTFETLERRITGNQVFVFKEPTLRKRDKSDWARKVSDSRQNRQRPSPPDRSNTHYPNSIKTPEFQSLNTEEVNMK